MRIAGFLLTPKGLPDLVTAEDLASRLSLEWTTLSALSGPSYYVAMEGSSANVREWYREHSYHFTPFTYFADTGRWGKDRQAIAILT